MMRCFLLTVLDVYAIYKLRGDFMKFKFDVNKTDKDYTDFVVFTNTKTKVGRMYDLILRILITVLFGGSFLIRIIQESFAFDAVVFYAMFWLIPGVILHIIVHPLFVLGLRLLCLGLSKGKGKKPYTVFETIEFYDDYMISTEEYMKVEYQYPIFESIYVIENKGIHLNKNKGQSKSIPEHCFASSEQKEKFVEFIKTKCSDVVYYK